MQIQVWITILGQMIAGVIILLNRILINDEKNINKKFHANMPH